MIDIKLFNNFVPINVANKLTKKVKGKILYTQYSLENKGVKSSKWRNKNVIFYGDSITAQGNTDCTTGYGYGAEVVHKFNSIYRGIGGQTFKKNNNTWYANADGSYAGRKGQGGLMEAPTGTIEHLGYFSSWDRITASIPEAIRKTIDLVIINGGHNDFQSVEEVITDGKINASDPTWINACDYDSEWKSSNLYNGGDYDITKFTGAIASCIMKLQIWCPNALIVLATPFPRWIGMQQMKENNLTFRQLCEIEIATAKYMQIEVIDSNNKCGINGWNFESNTQNDNIHPNKLGRKNYGHTFIEALSNLNPKIK